MRLKKNPALAALGQQIKRARIKLGLTQEMAARILEIEYRHYQEIEYGRVDVRYSTYIQMQSKLFVLPHCRVHCKLQDPELVVIDFEGNCLFANSAWKHFGIENNLPPDKSSNFNYFEVCKAAAKDDHEEASAFLNGLLAIRSRTQNTCEVEYTCHSADELRWYLAQAHHIETPQQQSILIIHYPLVTIPVTQIRDDEGCCRT